MKFLRQSLLILLIWLSVGSYLAQDTQPVPLSQVADWELAFLPLAEAGGIAADSSHRPTSEFDDGSGHYLLAKGTIETGYRSLDLESLLIEEPGRSNPKILSLIGEPLDGLIVRGTRQLSGACANCHQQEILETKTSDPGDQGPTAEIERLNRQVVWLIEKGQYDRGIELAEEALAMAERTLGEGDPATGASLNNLAEIHLDIMF